MVWPLALRSDRPSLFGINMVWPFALIAFATYGRFSTYRGLV